MSWTPKTLLDADADTIRSFHIGTNSAGKEVYKCECGAQVVAGRLTDVRSMAYAQDFACDGCRTHWERTGIMKDGNELHPRSAREWKARWLAAHQAPQKELDKLETLRPKGDYTDTISKV